MVHKLVIFIVYFFERNDNAYYVRGNRSRHSEGCQVNKLIGNGRTGTSDADRLIPLPLPRDSNSNLPIATLNNLPVSAA